MQWFWSRLDIYAVIFWKLLSIFIGEFFNKFENKKMQISVWEKHFWKQKIAESVQLKDKIVVKFIWKHFQVKIIKVIFVLSGIEQNHFTFLNNFKYFEYFKESFDTER